jgi:hypothetical protein
MKMIHDIRNTLTIFQHRLKLQSQIIIAHKLHIVFMSRLMLEGHDHIPDPRRCMANKTLKRSSASCYNRNVLCTITVLFS